MTLPSIFVIKDEHDVDEAGMLDYETVGYVLTEEEAIRLTDMTDRIKVHDAKKAIYDKWYESRNTWQAENRHRFIDEWRIREYIAARNKCVANINGIKLPDLNKIPVERHALVLANHHAKLKPLHNKVAEYDEKISKCVSVDAANKHNEALLAERDALIGPEPESPGYLYRRVYEEVKPANT